jgi:hypothetical protein
MVVSREKSQALANHKTQDGASDGEKSQTLAHTGSGTS